MADGESLPDDEESEDMNRLVLVTVKAWKVTHTLGWRIIAEGPKCDNADRVDAVEPYSR
mgnify:FL=1